MRSTRRERAMDHAVRMSERRVAQRSRVPGFTPIRNNRISNAINAQSMALILASEVHLSVRDATDRAVEIVRRTLPSAPMVFNWANNCPTKNADPAYRKAIWPKAKLAGAHNWCGAGW